MLAKAGLTDKEAFRGRWMEDQARLLRDVPEANLNEMAEWVVEEHLWPTRRQVAIDALAAAAEEARTANPGARLLLATGAYRPLGEAFGRRIGADMALGTPLEVRDGVATGGLSGPDASGEAKAAAVAAEAAGGDVLAAFGDTVADIPLLRMADASGRGGPGRGACGARPPHAAGRSSKASASALPRGDRLTPRLRIDRDDERAMCPRPVLLTSLLLSPAAPPCGGWGLTFRLR